MSRLLLTLLVAAAVTGGLAATAGASTGRCLGDGTGPVCRFWTAKAVSINDGDTIGVDVDGDGNHREYQVRFLGLQAMELTRHSDNPAKQRGQCHALEATRRVRALLRRSHWRVRLSAQHASSRSGGRLARYVAVRLGGHWRDLGEILMTEGQTIFMGSGTEPAWNHRYNLAGQQAALLHIGMWSTTHCGSGPSQDVPLHVWADWDPPGDDQQNVNGEWIRVQNQSTTQSLPLGGWWVRDSMLRRFTFPRGTVLAPGEIATVHTGHGTASGTAFFWGLNGTLFPNVDGVDLGDGAYLFDPKGDLRQWMVYPCLAGCSDPNQGAVQLTAQPRGSDESVWLRNVAAGPVDLSPYVLDVPGSLIPFDPGTVLAPGDRIKVPVPGGRILPDSGGVVRLTTWSSISLACDAWGSGSC